MSNMYYVSVTIKDENGNVLGGGYCNLESLKRKDIEQSAAIAGRYASGKGLDDYDKEQEKELKGDWTDVK